MIGDDSVLAIVPARGASKGIPGKNLRTIGGRTLIAHTVSAAIGSELVDRTVVTTEDTAIAEEAIRCGAEVPFLRHRSLAGDETPMSDVIADVLDRIVDGAWIVLLQPTSPLRTSQDVDSTLVEAWRVGATSAVSLCPAEDHPAWLWTLTDTGRVRPVVENVAPPTRRQDLPPVFRRNGAVYAFRREWFLRTRAFSDDDTVGVVMPMERSVDIDTEIDLALAEVLYGMGTAAD